MIPKTYHGLHRGIIIANNDPEAMGRVKVFVPSVNLAMFSKWFEKEDGENKIFNGLGTNLESSLTPEIMEKLHKYLPWSEVAQPVFGMGSGGSYKASSGKTTPSQTCDDSGGSESTQSDSPKNYINNSNKISTDSKGKVNKDELNSFLEEEIKNSKLIGKTPEGSEKYGIDGSAKSWANYFTNMAEYESGFNNNSTNTSDPGGSYGLFQVSTLDGSRYNANPSGENWTVSELRNPENNARTAIAIHEKQILKTGSMETASGKGAGGYYAKATMDKIKNKVSKNGTTSSSNPGSSMTETPNYVSGSECKTKTTEGSSFASSSSNPQQSVAGGSNNPTYNAGTNQEGSKTT